MRKKPNSVWIDLLLILVCIGFMFLIRVLLDYHDI